MSTRSAIGIEQQNGSVKVVYCHSDGYPSHNGKLLLENYNSAEKANSIVKLGDLSYLDKSIEKPAGHTFEKPVDGYSVFYKRDRGEQGKTALVLNSAKSVFNELDSDYVYIFKPKENAWYYAKYDSKEFKPLTKNVVEGDYKDGGAIKGDRKFDYNKLNYTIGGL